MSRFLPALGVLLVVVLLSSCTTSPGTRAGSTVRSSTTTSGTPSTPVLPPLTTTGSTASPPTTSAAGSIGPVIVEPDAGMAPIYDFMENATTTLTMTMYELIDPTAEQILADDAGRGVHVRVLLDSALESSRNQAAHAYLISHQVAVAFAPTSRITHQKTICIDNRSCLIMSLNMVDDDYATTRDVAVEDSDPVDVAAIESTFAADFDGGTGPATSNGRHLLWSPGSEPGIVGVINGARQSLEVENEEMDSTAITDALAAAARRGVDVEVCMTADSSYTGALDQIAAAGGHVHLYPDTNGVLYIHEKLVVADVGSSSARAVVGSINFSTSSMDDNRELDIVLGEHDAPGPITVLGTAFKSDFNSAPEA